MKSILGGVLGVLLGIGVVALILSLPTMLLWNWCLVPAVDGINPIGIAQAIGITFLATILFKDNKANK